MSEKIQLKGRIYESCSDIPPNWGDMRNKFGYRTLYTLQEDI